jgi:hypothetical protein
MRWLPIRGGGSRATPRCHVDHLWGGSWATLDQEVAFKPPLEVAPTISEVVRAPPMAYGVAYI